MQGLREPSFLPRKKKPAPAGDEEGWIIPAATASMYFSMASLSRCGQREEATLGGHGAGQEVYGTVLRPMERQRGGPHIAENLLKVVVFDGHLRQVGG